VKVLFVTSHLPDYLSSMLYQGFCEIVGHQNVFEPIEAESLRNREGGPCGNIIHQPRPLFFGFHTLCDLMVVNSCFTRDRDWPWLASLQRRALTASAPVAYIEGWDSAEHEIYPPPSPARIDAVFRREINPDISYPYICHALPFAAPEHWFKDWQLERQLDVCCVHHYGSHPLRWESLRKVFETQSRHCSVVCSGNLNHATYWGILRRSKLCVVTPGAGSCADVLRMWEAVAAGAIPILVGHPRRKRFEPWFDVSEVFLCPEIEALPYVIDAALSRDLEPMRERLREKALAHHTTKARAQRILDVLRLHP
jgi:hypothetical protein